MILKSESLEIRGCEKKTSKYTNRTYLIVYLEEPMGKAVEVLDRKLSNEKFYKENKGKKARFTFQTQLFGRRLALAIVHSALQSEEDEQERVKEFFGNAEQAEEDGSNSKTAEIIG